ncbi:hypothetical protein WJU23_06850 [Prosthecobacter sp. SYSU 5D2]|uniref:hypothetical protein n=1 Tax=Prosthecobacter sp. SYSU 5D2 TaxID=3134134 RepID=UPI0031FEE267
MNSTLRLLLSGLVLSSLPACNKNAAVKQENAEIMQRVADIQTQIRQIEAETVALNPLGQYNITQAAHLEGYKSQIEVSKVRVQTLREELEETLQELDQAQLEFNSYKDKHRTL